MSLASPTDGPAQWHCGRGMMVPAEGVGAPTAVEIPPPPGGAQLEEGREKARGLALCNCEPAFSPWSQLKLPSKSATDSAGHDP